jgi:hypothetical protein
VALTPEGGERKWLKNWDGWVKACQEKHAGKYVYPSSERQSVNGRWYVRIVCPEHGEFSQGAAHHKMGKGCPSCAGVVMPINALELLKEALPDTDFSGVNLEGSKAEFSLVCPTHGEYTTNYNRLMTRSKQADIKTACPACNKVAGGLKKRKTLEDWKADLERAMGDRGYDFDWGTLTVSSSKMRVVCKEHGEFWAKPQELIIGKNGCPDCAKKARYDWSQDVRRLDVDEAVVRATSAKGGRYLYDMTTFKSQNEPMRMICTKHGEFWQIYRNHLTLDADCPRCSNSVSKMEDEIAKFLTNEVGIEVERRDRKVLAPLEVDVWVPSKSLAIEYCGTYWHGETKKTDTYHLEKLELAERAGIKLIQIFEDEWLNRKEAVRTRLRHLVGDSHRMFARKLRLLKVSWNDASTFYEDNHTQGSGTPASSTVGLYNGSTLVACMSFGASRFEEGTVEMLRFASTCAVVGGFSRLLKAYMRANPTVDSLVSYADRRWSAGDVYASNGFEFVGNTAPGYSWCKGRERFSRFSMQKHRLEKVLTSFDPDKTEVENCHANGYWRIFDCGVSKWLYRRTS